MSQRISNNVEGECCLYDSATGFAFGPLFPNPFIADQFVSYCEKAGYAYGDIRALSDDAIENLWSTWNDLCKNG